VWKVVGLPAYGRKRLRATWRDEAYVVDIFWFQKDKLKGDLNPVISKVASRDEPGGTWMQCYVLRPQYFQSPCQAPFRSFASVRRAPAHDPIFNTVASSYAAIPASCPMLCPCTAYPGSNHSKGPLYQLSPFFTPPKRHRSRCPLLPSAYDSGGRRQRFSSC